MTCADILLAVDFDRTLTAPDSSIPEANLRAVREFTARGGTFTVNTGRSLPMARRILEEVPVNAPLLLYNGSAAYDPQTRSLTQVHPIALDRGAFARDLSERFPWLHVELEGEHAHYILRPDPDWVAYTENQNCPWACAAAEEIPGPFLKAALLGDLRGKTVASMYISLPEEEARFAQLSAYIQEAYGQYVDGFRACARILDIHAKGCSKLRAARELQARLGKKLLVCVGDAENDLTMLRGADHAFCPADSVIAGQFSNVCACAEGAVAEVINKKIPEILQELA